MDNAAAARRPAWIMAPISAAILAAALGGRAAARPADDAARDVADAAKTKETRAKTSAADAAARDVVGAAATERDATDLGAWARTVLERKNDLGGRRDPAGAAVGAPARLPGRSMPGRYPPILAFASLAMPEASLRAYIDQAAKAGAVVVLRGFVNGSLRDTVAAVRRLLGQANAGGLAIDPTLYRRFAVARVPVVVALDRPPPPCRVRHCDGEPVPDHDRVAGDVTLYRALRLFAGGGGPGAETARTALARLQASGGDGR